ncbi:hypothetical protein ACOSP7_002928 [Xanthoceras sorbifolium]
MRGCSVSVQIWEQICRSCTKVVNFRDTCCRRFVIESDSAEAVRLVNGDPNPNHHCFNLIYDCKALMLEDWFCAVIHIFREGNTLSDGLAQLSHHLERGILFFEEPPPYVLNHFQNDFVGLIVARQMGIS